MSSFVICTSTVLNCTKPLADWYIYCSKHTYYRYCVVSHLNRSRPVEILLQKSLIELFSKGFPSVLQQVRVHAVVSAKV